MDAAGDDRPDKEFHATGTMKVPVMIDLFRQTKASRLRLDDPLRG